jgi:hypothetical protein
LNCGTSFENVFERRIFGPKRDEVTGGWRNLHNEEHRDLYSSPSIIRIIKSRRMRWAVHLARVRRETHANVFSGKAGRKVTTKKTKTYVDG